MAGQTLRHAITPHQTMRDQSPRLARDDIGAFERVRFFSGLIC
jgi:hypothetical protein